MIFEIRIVRKINGVWNVDWWNMEFQCLVGIPANPNDVSFRILGI